MTKRLSGKSYLTIAKFGGITAQSVLTKGEVPEEGRTGKKNQKNNIELNNIKNKIYNINKIEIDY